jgi:hypothetical protein
VEIFPSTIIVVSMEARGHSNNSSRNATGSSNTGKRLHELDNDDKDDEERTVKKCKPETGCDNEITDEVWLFFVSCVVVVVVLAPLMHLCRFPNRRWTLALTVFFVGALPTGEQSFFMPSNTTIPSLRPLLRTATPWMSYI